MTDDLLKVSPLTDNVAFLTRLRPVDGRDVEITTHYTDQRDRLDDSELRTAEGRHDLARRLIARDYKEFRVSASAMLNEDIRKVLEDTVSEGNLSFMRRSRYLGSGHKWGAFESIIGKKWDWRGCPNMDRKIGRAETKVQQVLERMKSVGGISSLANEAIVNLQRSLDRVIEESNKQAEHMLKLMYRKVRVSDQWLKEARMEDTEFAADLKVHETQIEVIQKKVNELQDNLKKWRVAKNKLIRSKMYECHAPELDDIVKARVDELMRQDPDAGGSMFWEGA